MNPKRPTMRYHGGKWRIAPWIIRHFPPHRIYVEPYCGAASVLLRKPRCHAEVINDLDGRVVNLFRVLRSPILAAELERQIRLTPFAREEFERAWDETDDPIENARRLLIRSFMGFGSTSLRPRRTGFRARTYQRNVPGPQDWATWPEQIKAFTERLQRVLIENKPALDVIRLHDSPTTLFYIDPPYLPDNRSTHGKAYLHEMTPADHGELLETVLSIDGMAVISSYKNKLYDHTLTGWQIVEKEAIANHGVRRTEALYISPRAIKELMRMTQLF